MKKYTWHCHRLENGKWIFVKSFRCGATEKAAFNYFNGYVAETLEDGKYGCVRHVPKKDGTRPVIFVEVYR